jgi:glyoxylase-like metal-dependent hydrolase (beta-lactamase superfamily II)
MASTATERRTMEAIVPGLHASGSDPLPFAPSLHIRAFLLQRPAGNVLVYSAPALAAETAAIEELGGISRRYLNHGHEAMFLVDGPGPLAAPLFVHRDDSGPVAREHAVRGTFDRRHSIDGDLEVIPIPGHTPGATAYLWDSGEHRVLFTGDTIYLDRGEWVAAVLESSDRDAYLGSLELIRELDFDLLVPWAASAGHPYHAATDRTDARRRIEAIIERVRRCGSG